MLRELLQIMKLSINRWLEDKVPQLAAALAYYTIFSLAPLLVIAIGVAGIVFGQEAAQGQIVQQIRGLVGIEGARLVEDSIAAAGRGNSDILATAIGVATLLFGATSVFAQLQDSLNAIWGVAPKPGRSFYNLLQTRFLSFAMVLTIGFLLMVSLIINALLAGFDETLRAILPNGQLFLTIFNFCFSFGVVTLLFAMMFRFLPDAKVRWADVWIGALVTAFLFTIGKFLIGLYLGNSTIGSAYGAAGSFAVLLIWIYYSAQIVLFGAEFTQVYARRHGSTIVPAEDAVKVVTTTTKERAPTES